MGFTTLAPISNSGGTVAPGTSDSDIGDLTFNASYGHGGLLDLDIAGTTTDLYEQLFVRDLLFLISCCKNKQSKCLTAYLSLNYAITVRG